MIEQVVQGVFEVAGQQLPMQINGEKPGARVDVFVARHEVCFIAMSMGDIDADGRLGQDAEMEVFLQLRKEHIC
ncbi:MAG TPA: hypothetical protein VK138_13210 [Acidiferrobacterales bacterium]|nr:hypothetical protein [Acidiferrobacterales bacterium]